MKKAAALSVVLGAVGMFACSSTDRSESAPEATTRSNALAMQLVGVGDKLRFAKAPKPAYEPEYPNINEIGKMEVRVKSSGALVSTCGNFNGEPTPCGDTPFFTKVDRTPSGGVVVTVRDIYGQEVGSQEFEAGSESESTGSGDESTDDDVEDCSCGEYGEDGGAASCDDTTATNLRDEFCAKVNEYLKNNDYPPIDCNALDNDDYGKMQPNPPQGSKGKCEGLWRPHFRKVSVWVNTCKAYKRRATHWHEVVRWQLLHKGACKSSPLVLDLDGQGVRLSTPETGVSFDLLGDGKVRASWVESGALLALDRNGNGQIDGAAELFGNATGGREWTDGFAAAASLDDNGDGVLDAKDRVFGELVVWRDRNHDGVSTPNELSTLPESGVKRLFLGAARIEGAAARDANGNELPLVGGFERNDGTRGAMIDVFLRYKPL